MHRVSEEAATLISSREELGAKVRRLQEAVAEIHGITQLGGVTIRTDANGRLTGLDVSRDAYVRGPDVLADLIMRAYGQTADDVQQRTAAVLAELRDDPSVARIVDVTSSRANSEVAVEPAQFGDFSVAQHSFSSQPNSEPPSRGPDETEKCGDSYYQRKSWLE